MTTLEQQIMADVAADAAGVARTETPRTTVAKAVQRMALVGNGGAGCGASEQEALALRRRWPTIADADRDMRLAIATMTDDDRAADRAECDANLALEALWA